MTSLFTSRCNTPLNNQVSELPIQFENLAPNLYIIYNVNLPVLLETPILVLNVDFLKLSSRQISSNFEHSTQLFEHIVEEKFSYIRGDVKATSLRM